MTQFWEDVEQSLALTAVRCLSRRGSKGGGEPSYFWGATFQRKQLNETAMPRQQSRISNFQNFELKDPKTSCISLHNFDYCDWALTTHKDSRMSLSASFQFSQRHSFCGRMKDLMENLNFILQIDSLNPLWNGRAELESSGRQKREKPDHRSKRDFHNTRLNIKGRDWYSKKVNLLV